MASAFQRNLAHRPIELPDILDAIIDVCQVDSAYGTIELLGSLSKHHRVIVQPRLKRIKAMVVLTWATLVSYRHDLDWSGVRGVRGRITERSTSGLRIEGPW